MMAPGYGAIENEGRMAGKLIFMTLLLTVLAGCSHAADEPPRQALLTTECTDPRPQMCTMDYRPVCAQRDTGIRCVTTPCPSSEWKTYSNGCSACSDPNVSGYRGGSCDDDPDAP
jgi:hypothetical protein